VQQVYQRTGLIEQPRVLARVVPVHVSLIHDD
jgi:hypothetical protein